MKFSKLKPSDWLDTGDLVRLLRVSGRTVQRYVADHGLRPLAVQVGRELFFRKGDVVAWMRKVGWGRSRYLRRPRKGGETNAE